MRSKKQGDRLFEVKMVVKSKKGYNGKRKAVNAVVCTVPIRN